MITSGTYLTAAHCLADTPAPNTSNIVLVVGFAGSYDEFQSDFPHPCTQSSLTSFVASKAANAHVMAIAGFQKPIHYNKRSGYDIMLVFAKADQCPSGTGPTIKMNGQCGGFDATVGSANMMTLLGFGATVGEKGVPSPVLKKLDSAVESVGTSDQSCNNNVGYDLNSVVCAKETPATGCADANGNPTPNAQGCTPGVKGASGDSGGPWITQDATGGVRTHVFVQSSGVKAQNGDSYGFLMRDAWFQDWIYEIMKTNDNCGGINLTTDDLFMGYSSSQNQYCQGHACRSCADSVVTDANCLSQPSCAIPPTIATCLTIPTQNPLPNPTCSGSTNPSSYTSSTSSPSTSGPIYTGSGSSSPASAHSSISSTRKSDSPTHTTSSASNPSGSLTTVGPRTTPRDSDLSGALAFISFSRLAFLASVALSVF